MVRGRIVGVAARGALSFLAAESGLKLVENLARDLVLHGEQVGRGPVVLVAPELGSVGDVHKFGLDHQTIAAQVTWARDDRADVQVAADLRGIRVLALVAKHDAPRADAQARQLREAIDQRLGNAVGEVLDVSGAAGHRERQHGHRVDRARASPEGRRGR